MESTRSSASWSPTPLLGSPALASARETSQEHACDHCGQPVPLSRLARYLTQHEQAALDATSGSATSATMPIASGSSTDPSGHPAEPRSSEILAFCCDGCETVYQVLHGAGLEQYYRVRDALGEQDRPVQLAQEGFEALDAESFTRRYVRTTARGTQEVDLYLEGVHCAACVWLVEKLPQVAPGCVNARLDFTRARATVEWDGQKTQLSALARLLGSLGYKPHPWRHGDIASLRKQEDQRLWMRIGVAAAVVMNVMFLAIAMYAGEYSALGGGAAGGLDPTLDQLFRWASLAIFLPSVMWSAWPFFSGALASLRSGVLHMDLPLSIGILVGFVASAWRVILGHGDIYFDSLGMLICLLLVARWFQKKGQRAAGEAAELLQALTSSSARVVNPDSGQETPLQVDALLPGMQVRVLSGESIPADGLVMEGSSFVDRAVLSGESEPVAVAVGEKVYAGTVNLQSPLLITLTETGEETRVGRLMRMMEEASSRRAPIVQLADRLTGMFVATVLGLSVLTAMGWSMVSPDRALEHVVALLIVTCPCALGMATPVALAVAIGRAARQGVLIKGGDAVERLAHARHILLDKTGTLTEGKLSLTSWTGDDEARSLLFTVEQSSAHPLAKAAVRGLEGARVLPIGKVEEVLGGGLVARYQPDGAAERLETGPETGAEVVVGSRRFMDGRGVQLPTAMAQALDEVLARGHSPVLVAVAGVVRGVAGFGDPLRADTRDAILKLKSLGFTVGILSGDHPTVVANVGQQLGLDPARVFGGLSPEQKLAHVEAAVKAGEVVMVGDGVNDAAALSAASVGVSVHGGAEASLAAADVFLTRPGLMPVVACVEGARATLGVVRRNLTFSIGYNLLGAGLAMGGLMGPLLAALLMPFSSGTVVGSSLVGGGFRAPVSKA